MENTKKLYNLLLELKNIALARDINKYHQINELFSKEQKVLPLPCHKNQLSWNYDKARNSLANFLQDYGSVELNNKFRKEALEDFDKYFSQIPNPIIE